MLFGRNAGEGLEPVRVMRCAVGNRPILHCGRNRIGNADVQLRPFINGPPQGLIHLCRQVRLHHPVIKHEASEIILHSFHTTISFSVGYNKKQRRLYVETHKKDAFAFIATVFNLYLFALRAEADIRRTKQKRRL